MCLYMYIVANVNDCFERFLKLTQDKVMTRSQFKIFNFTSVKILHLSQFKHHCNSRLFIFKQAIILIESEVQPNECSRQVFLSAKLLPRR